MVYTMVYIYGIYHGIYHLPLLYMPWYIPKVVYTTFGVVYTMRQPSRCCHRDGRSRRPGPGRRPGRRPERARKGWRHSSGPPEPGRARRLRSRDRNRKWGCWTCWCRTATCASPAPSGQGCTPRSAPRLSSARLITTTQPARSSASTASSPTCCTPQPSPASGRTGRTSGVPLVEFAIMINVSASPFGSEQATSRALPRPAPPPPASAAPPPPLPPTGFTVESASARLSALVGWQLLYWWLDDGWQQGTVARLCPRCGGCSFSHVVAYTLQISALCGTDSLLDSASYGARWVLLSPAPASWPGLGPQTPTLTFSLVGDCGSSQYGPARSGPTAAVP